MRNFIRHLPRAILFGFVAAIGTAWLLALTPPVARRGPLALPCNPLDGPAYLKGVLVSSSLYRYEWAPASVVDPSTDWDRLHSTWKQKADFFSLAASPPGICLCREWPAEYLMRVDRWPRWAQLPRGTRADTGLGSDQGLSIDARGFPFPALLCSTIVVSPLLHKGPIIPHPVRDGITIRRPAGVMNDNWAALPLKPIPLGFTIDTLFFALCYFGALGAAAGIRALRAQDRQLRHQCPACAYTLTGLPSNSPCPECGRAL